MNDESTPLWLTLLLVAIPFVAAAVAWLRQTLVQQAWDDYERRRAVYGEVVRDIEALVSGDALQTQQLLAHIRLVWLVGSDEVVTAWNSLSSAIKTDDPQRETKFSEFMLAMRRDLAKRRWLPPLGTALRSSDFPIESPGRRTP